jgi:ketosteroid isomerase-like protein
MSQENVETARRANAAMNRGDFQGVGEVFAEDAVLEDLQNAPDQPMKVEGVEAIRTTLSLWAAAFDELHADIEEYIETPEWGGLRRALEGTGEGERDLDRQSPVRPVRVP